jgi:hypothetical protein
MAEYYGLDGRRLEGCAFGPCRDSIKRGGVGCRLCDVIVLLPQPPTSRRAVGELEIHKREKANAARDGDPKLAGEKKRGNLAFEKRRRVGPHR